MLNLLDEIFPEEKEELKTSPTFAKATKEPLQSKVSPPAIPTSSPLRSERTPVWTSARIPSRSLTSRPPLSRSSPMLSRLPPGYLTLQSPQHPKTQLPSVRDIFENTSYSTSETQPPLRPRRDATAPIPLGVTRIQPLPHLPAGPARPRSLSLDSAERLQKNLNIFKLEPEKKKSKKSQNEENPFKTLRGKKGKEFFLKTYNGAKARTLVDQPLESEDLLTFNEGDIIYVTNVNTQVRYERI